MRATSVAPSDSGIESTTRTAPFAVSKSVSSTSVPGRYRRSARTTSPAGASLQRPCRSSPSSAAKQAAESKRGRHSQSIDPSRPTSAAVRVSPISA
jgi:hypothetical protein